MIITSFHRTSSKYSGRMGYCISFNITTIILHTKSPQNSMLKVAIDLHVDLGNFALGFRSVSQLGDSALCVFSLELRLNGWQWQKLSRAHGDVQDFLKLRSGTLPFVLHSFSRNKSCGGAQRQGATERSLACLVGGAAKSQGWEVGLGRSEAFGPVMAVSHSWNFLFLFVWLAITCSFYSKMKHFT